MNDHPKLIVVFIEGPSGLDKTAVAKKSFYTDCCEDSPIYELKHKSNSIQLLYELKSHVNLFNLLLKCVNIQTKLTKDSTRVYNRSFVSQFVYNLINEYDGYRTPPKEFKRKVCESYMNNYEFQEELKHVTFEWSQLFARFGLKMELRICIADDVSFTRQVLINRDPTLHENELYSKWNLSYYIENQNYLFEYINNIIQPNEDVVRVKHFINIK